jgi:hypothetical protein
LLRNDGEQGVERALGYLDQMSNAAVRAGQVVSGCAQWSARRRVQKDLVQVEQVIADALSLALPDAHVRGITIEVSVAPEAAAVLGDTVQIEQVLTNLVRNGAEAMANSRVRRLSVGRDARVGAKSGRALRVRHRARDRSGGERPNCSRPFRPARSTAWGWACPSAAPSSSGMAERSGWTRATPRVPLSALSHSPRLQKRTARERGPHHPRRRRRCDSCGTPPSCCCPCRAFR